MRVHDTGPMSEFRAYAHRGGTEHAPENSHAAFASAVAMGCRYLETDVRATRDGVAVIHHDATLDRTTDSTGTIRQMPWAQVRQARIGGQHPISRLDDLLGDFPDVTVNLDIKDASVIGPLLDALRRTASFDRVCLTSFSTARLNAVRRHIPDTVATSAGPREVAAVYAASRVGRSSAPRLGATRLQIPERAYRRTLLDDRFLSATRAWGLPIDVWTVNDPADMKRLLDLGVDGIMTDRPSVLLGLLND